MPERTTENIRNIVLVHGAFVDGSGWQGVYRLLRGQGYNVSVVQHSTATLADVRAVRQVLAAQDGPTVLVGHSYGGAVITEPGTDETVAALVFVTAFAPDAGESVATWYGMPAYTREGKVVYFFRVRRSSKRGTRRSASATQRTSTTAPCGRPPSR